MKTIQYYPGCALYIKAKNFDISAKESFKILGINLEELTSWTCCGTAFPLIDTNIMNLVAPIRNLANANKHGCKLATGCNCCYNTLKRANLAIKQDKEKQKKINLFLERDFQVPYSGEVETLHLLELLRDEIGFDKLTTQIKTKLKGLNVACFYGCLLLRPYDEIQLDKPEQPKILDDFVKSLGAKAIDFPYKLKCCGSYLTVKFPEIAKQASEQILTSAKKAGANAITVSCPLCFYNLEQAQKELTPEKQIPIFYFTQILGLALEIDQSLLGFDKHRVDPRFLLKKHNLI